MKLSQFKKLFDFLKKDYKIIGPNKEKGGKLKIKPLNDFKQLDLSGRIPENSYKEYLLPFEEDILIFDKNKVKEVKEKIIPQALIGITQLDLKAIALFDQIFKRDPYYQRRRRNTILIGFSLAPEEIAEYKKFFVYFEENVLEHLVFDIFITKLNPREFRIYTGSYKGQRILENLPYKNYEHIQFAGLIPEEGLDRRMLALRKKVALSSNHKIWKELAKICLACGKCSLVCPTCFCFNLKDKFIASSKAKKIRQLTSCFYTDFSEIAGGYKFLDTLDKRLYFWYYHKFVRIPDELSLPGCVGCLRCVKACPVGIDLRKVLNSL